MRPPTPMLDETFGRLALCASLLTAACGRAEDPRADRDTVDRDTVEQRLQPELIGAETGGSEGSSDQNELMEQLRRLGYVDWDRTSR